MGLTEQRYGAKPQNFCLSYDDIRKHDINSQGDDLECHKNDEELSDCTITLDDKSLRDAYQNVGIIDEDRKFKIKELVSKAEEIDSNSISQEENVIKQLEALSRYMPDFAKCQNSTMSILKNISLNQKNMDFNKCVVSRVYSKENESKKSCMYIYLNIPEIGDKFYIADGKIGLFIDIPKDEFTEKYECYEKDLSKNKGIRPWEKIEEPVEEFDDLTKSSGKIVATEKDDKGEDKIL